MDRTAWAGEEKRWGSRGLYSMGTRGRTHSLTPTPCTIVKHMGWARRSTATEDHVNCQKQGGCRKASCPPLFSEGDCETGVTTQGHGSRRETYPRTCVRNVHAEDSQTNVHRSPCLCMFVYERMDRPGAHGRVRRQPHLNRQQDWLRIRSHRAFISRPQCDLRVTPTLKSFEWVTQLDLPAFTIISRLSLLQRLEWGVE